MEKKVTSKNDSKTNKFSKKNSKNRINTQGKQEKSTRLKDSYYNPKLHKRNWEPSGKFIEKNKYTYGDTGLGYNLKDSNKIQKDKSTLDKTQTHFLEFDFIENNEIIITIEHCSNCEQHLNHTNHVNDIYKKISRLLQSCINIRFPFIKVFLKPIDTSNNKYLNRLGALEIQLAMKINDKKIITTLFSKLNTNQWPNFINILNKINHLVPLLNIKCTIYDKEEEDTENSIMDNNNNNNNDIGNNNNQNKINQDTLLALPSKYENIKINLYALKNNQIEQMCQEAADQLDIAFNPKRKMDIFYESKTFNTNTNKNSDSNKNTIYNNLLNNNKSRINSSNINNTNNNLKLTQKTLSSRPKSGIKNKSAINNNSFNFNYSKKNDSSLLFLNQSKRGEIIEDISIVNQLKGKLLSTGYADKSGTLFFENVPYDSYLIEIENNKNFLGCGMVLQFQKIYLTSKANNKKNIAENGNYVLNKLIGLKRQIDAYVEVYLFSKEKKENENNDFTGVNLISGARVTLIKKFFDSGDIVSGNIDEFDLEENKKIKGRYEIVTMPGEAELNIFKQGYENVYKQLILKNGINKINIELLG